MTSFKKLALVSSILVALLLVLVVKLALVTPASKTSVSEAYAIAHENSITACRKAAEQRPGLACERVELDDMAYKNYLPTDNSNQAWLFYFRAGTSPNLWDYNVSLDVSGKVTFSEGKMLNTKPSN